MITLQIDGACKDCPFMRLNVVEGVEWNVYCEHEIYCDREVKDGEEDKGLPRKKRKTILTGENHVSEIPKRG